MDHEPATAHILNEKMVRLKRNKVLLGNISELIHLLKSNYFCGTVSMPDAGLLCVPEARKTNRHILNKDTNHTL